MAVIWCAPSQPFCSWLVALGTNTNFGPPGSLGDNLLSTWNVVGSKITCMPDQGTRSLLDGVLRVKAGKMFCVGISTDDP